MKLLIVVLSTLYCFAVSIVIADERVVTDRFILVQTGTDESPTRLLVTIAGKSLPELWNIYFDRLFAFLDRDGDQGLNATEAARAPSPAWLKVQWRGDFDNVPTPMVDWRQIDQAPRDGRISRDELAAWYRSQGLGDVELQAGRSTAALDETSTRRLFNQLANKENAWDENVGNHAAQKLRRYDMNDDERWTAAELKSAELSKSLNEKPSSAPSALAPLQYSTERKGPLLNIDLRTTGDTVGEIRVARSINATSIDWLPNRAGARSDSMTMVEKGVQVKIMITGGLAPQAFRSAGQSLLQQFEIDDLDHNHALDATEAKQSSLRDTFQALLTVADQNTDAQLSNAELQAYLDLQSLAASQHVCLSIADDGIPLFEMLDANADGHLTLRELGRAWDRASLLTGNFNSQRLTWSDLPHRHQWTFSIGPARSTKSPPGSQPTAPVTAPAWFTKMDRNHDGDLSRREFLGDAREFQRLDQDSDGLISPAEAVQGFQ